jgi:hypothetical protein
MKTCVRIDPTQSMDSVMIVFPYRVLLISSSNSGIAGAMSNQGNRYPAMILPINIINRVTVSWIKEKN